MSLGTASPLRALSVIAVVFAAAGCMAAPSAAPSSPAPSASPMPSDSPLATEPTASSTSAVSDPSASATPPTEPSADPVYRLTYGWDTVPSRVTVAHEVNPPLAPPPELPLPYLVGVEVTDHPGASPAFQRVSFTFRGAFPGYNLEYVAALTAEGSGGPIPLDGNAVLRIGFVGAQAHDNDGLSTVVEAPVGPIELQNLRSVGFAGDYEGYVTFGLGLQVAVDSDQVLSIRAGESQTRDAAGQENYLIHVDVMTG